MLHLRSILAFVCALIALQASASIITWTTPVTFSSPSDVANNGTLVAAEGTFSGGALTINGVLFAPGGTTGNEIDITGSNIPSGAFGTISTGDAAYTKFLNAGGVSGGDGSPESINLSGLTIGADYRIQIWTPAWDNTFPTSFVAGNTVDMANSQFAPTFVFGTFTADATTQSIQFRGTSGSHGLVAGAALFTNVPEPSTWALLGLGGVCVVAGARWRKRRGV